MFNVVLYCHWRADSILKIKDIYILIYTIFFSKLNNKEAKTP